MMKIPLNDTSVLLNPLAGDCLAQVTEATGRRFAICAVVRDEVKKLRDPHTGEMVQVDIFPFIHSGLLQVLELSGEEEQYLYVGQSLVVDDGEAMSIAIAASRDLELAMDDRQATNHTRRTFPGLRLWSTPELLKQWVDTGAAVPSRLREVIRHIEGKARYFPPKSHALAEWWATMRQT